MVPYTYRIPKALLFSSHESPDNLNLSRDLSELNKIGPNISVCPWTGVGIYLNLSGDLTLKGSAPIFEISDLILQ